MKKNVLIISLFLLSAVMSYSQIRIVPAKPAPTVVPRVQMYVLTVNSSVPGYTVFIDNKLVRGNRVELQAGKYEVTVKANGYLDYSTNVNLNKNITLNAPLRAISYSLTINPNVNVYTVYLDNRQISGNRVMVNPGSHTIMIKAIGYEDYNVNLNVNDDIVLNAQLILIKPKNAMISINIPSNSLNTMMKDPLNQIRVYDNGVFIRDFNFEVTPGDHIIRIESGSLIIESRYNFLPGQKYSIEPVMYLNIQ